MPCNEDGRRNVNLILKAKRRHALQIQQTESILYHLHNELCTSKRAILPLCIVYIIYRRTAYMSDWDVVFHWLLYR